MTPFVELTIRDRVATLRLDRPATMNAIGAMEECEEVIAALDAIGNDSEVAVAILTGTGRAFCAGGNLKVLRDRDGMFAGDQPDTTRANYRRGVGRMVRTFMDVEVPLIAAVNGHAIGLGCDLACLCDIRIAAASAKFAASFVKVGLIPGDGGAWSLQRVVGFSQAAELFFTGDTFDAAAALEMKLVSRVVPDAALMDEALALAARIAANPPRALRLTKRLLREGQQQSMNAVLELSAAFQALAHETADHREAVNALIDKRTPKFTGG